MAQKFKFHNYVASNDIALNFVLSGDAATELVTEGLTFKTRPNKSFIISFELIANKELFNTVLTPDESANQGLIDFYLSYSSGLSRKRDVIKFIPSSNISLGNDLLLDCQLHIEPQEWSGSIQFIAHAVRNSSAKKATNYLTHKYAILGSSDTHKLHIDPLIKLKGSKLKIDEGAVARKHSLYQLIHANPPRLIINKDAPKSILRMLRSKGDGPQSPRTLMRDAAFSSIRVDVWEQLARTAVSKMIPDDESAEIIDPEFLAYPHNRVIEKIAKKLYGSPGSSQKSDINTLKGELRTLTSRLTLLNETLPMLAQELGSLITTYKRTADNYWK